jgi:hypothetical protein
MSEWTIVLTDLSFNELGQVRNASDRQFTFARSASTQVRFGMRMDNPLAKYVADLECYVKLYRDKELMCFGPMVNSEEKGDDSGGSWSCTAMSQEWIFNQRVVGKSQLGTRFKTLTDRATIAMQLITEADGDDHHHIYLDSASYSGSTTTYVAGPYKKLATCIAEQANLLDGFDWQVIPAEPWSIGGVTYIGTWSARPLIGSTRPEAIFEYGVGKANISEYSLQTDRSTQANKVYNPGTGAQELVSQLDSTSITKWGLMEDVADLQLRDKDMRQKLVDEHINVRKNPRRVVTFTPVPVDGTTRVPVFGQDYEVGDTVTARAAIGNSVRFNGEFRVYGVQVNLDGNGVEALQLTLTDEGA